jgi:uncharacterized protein (DUF1330 family)
MQQRIALGLAMLAGIGIGATAITGLNAQNTVPGAYVVVDISEITDRSVLSQIIPKADAVNAAFGGKFIIRTESVTALDGTPPKRFVVVAFDSIDKAKAWSTSPAQKEIDALRGKMGKSRQFIVDGKVN